METAGRALLVALGFNLIVLIPVTSLLLVDLTQIENGFGPRTDARQILTAIYVAIAMVSFGLIGLHVKRASWAVPMTVALFAVQITYKVLTVPMVGFPSPVVISNMIVVLVQTVALVLLWRAMRAPSVKS